MVWAVGCGDAGRGPLDWNVECGLRVLGVCVQRGNLLCVCKPGARSAETNLLCTKVSHAARSNNLCVLIFCWQFVGCTFCAQRGIWFCDNLARQARSIIYFVLKFRAQCEEIFFVY